MESFIGFITTIFSSYLYLAVVSATLMLGPVSAFIIASIGTVVIYGPSHGGYDGVEDWVIKYSIVIAVVDIVKHLTKLGFIKLGWMKSEEQLDEERKEKWEEKNKKFQEQRNIERNRWKETRRKYGR
jgi:type IV secretory pathway VirB6-like protein